MGETANPSDQPSANDTGNRPDIKNSLDNLGDMKEALPPLSGNSKHNEQDFPNLPKGSSQIPGIPTASTAPPIPKRPTPVPAIYNDSWDFLGPVSKKGTDGTDGIDAGYFAGWSDEDSDTGDQPKEQTKLSGKDSVAAGKQPERPSLVKEASLTKGGGPIKPTGTRSYAGTTQAPPPDVQETAQSLRTVLKPGNAAAKPTAPQTNAPPIDQTDNTSGFQTVQPRKPRGSSDRGRGEARSNKGGHQGSKFGQF